MKVSRLAALAIVAAFAACHGVTPTDPAADVTVRPAFDAAADGGNGLGSGNRDDGGNGLGSGNLTSDGGNGLGSGNFLPGGGDGSATVMSGDSVPDGAARGTSTLGSGN